MSFHKFKIDFRCTRVDNLQKDLIETHCHTKIGQYYFTGKENSHAKNIFLNPNLAIVHYSGCFVVNLITKLIEYMTGL